MRDTKEIQNGLHQRMKILAELQGEDCPSFSTLANQIRHLEYESLDKWLQSAPLLDSPEYTVMREEYITKVVTRELKWTGVPSRHAQQSVKHTNKDWVATYQKVSKRITENDDAMITLLGPRGTGKTQMAVELIRMAAGNRVREGMMDVHNQERWAWRYYDSSRLIKGCALYANTMDFFLRLRKTYGQESDEQENDVLKQYIIPPLLILDEVHDRRESDWENKMFTYLIDQRYQTASKQTIFIANQTAAQFESSVGSSIADRIQECGGTVECNWKSFRGGR